MSLFNSIPGASFVTGAISGISNTLGGVKDIISGISVSDDTLGQSQYNFNYRAFPNDLGMEYNGHYMVINVNVPVRRNNELRSQFGNQFTFLPNEFSKVDVLRFGTGPGATDTGGRQREIASIPRYTRRIAESIALFMPNAMVYSSTNAYEDISLTAIAGAVGVGAVTGLLGRLNIPGAGFVASVAGVTGSVIGQATRIAGTPINPRVEVLYATTPQRSFVFEVLMAPRNERESVTIQEIVRTLRFHSAPEIGFAGLTLVPPAEFDITFYNKGVENLAIPRINTCVLERVDVDYAPTGTGFSTFSNGYPVAVRLSLGFREVEILHKARVLQGF
jgi:hypothetical protein